MYYGSVISSSETPTDVSKRVNLTLPDIVYDELEAWAEYQGRPVANLAAYLVESSITVSYTHLTLPTIYSV